jgi:cytochrome c553
MSLNTGKSKVSLACQWSGIRRWCLLGAAMMCLSAPTHAADGRAIYLKHCASCHGKTGQGKKSEYKEPLVGDWSITKLTRYVDKKMPEDEEKTVVGKDAAAVSKYIHETFYSPAAQLRNNPPRLELTRLTVGQYRNSTSDLIDSFRSPNWWSTKNGLRVNYRAKKSKKTVDRNEPLINGNYGNKPPAAGIESKEGYNVRFSGSLRITQSGVYEFIVETPNGFKLYINDDQKPLIDKWVRSGNTKRHTTSMRLLGGRMYPLRLEMFKEKREKAAFIQFKWKPPHGVEQLVPERHFSTTGSHPTFVAQTTFPPDDRSLGYERGSSVSKAWDEATTYAALEAADFVIRSLNQQKAFAGKKSDITKRLADFAKRFVEGAFGRPLSSSEQTFFIDRHLAEAKTPERLIVAVKKIVLLSLKSPRFLFPESRRIKSDAYTVASRMALGLWDSIPDKKLLEAARSGKLKDRKGVENELRRMLKDPRTQAKVRRFYHHWLQLDHFYDLSKSSTQFPKFDNALVSDLRTSLDLFLDDVTWSKESDYRRLLSSDAIYLNGRLAGFYGGDLPPDAPFKKVSLKNQTRAGILTHPLLMAGFAYDSTTSPIHRGVFVARSLLGRRLRPPKEAVTPLPPKLHPSLTTRQRIAKQTQPAACASCHTMINPLGFPMENFDAVGRFRSKEKNKPLDTTGSYELSDGKRVPFKGPEDLAKFLSGHPQAHEAFVERLFQEMVKQPVAAYGLDRQKQLTKSFAARNYNIQQLLIEIIATVALQSGKPALKGKSP